MDGLLKTLAKLIAAQSVLDTPSMGAPFGAGNLDALEVMLAAGRECGFRTHNGGGYYGYIDYAGEGEGIIGILCHLDVVPAGEGWSCPPFKLTVTDGYAYGRGVVDNKGPAVCVLEAMRELKQSGYVPRRTIRLILGCNEESGSACIARYRNEQDIPTACFVPDADFPVVVSEMGILHLRLEIEADGLDGISIKGGERTNVVPDRCAVIIRGEEKILTGTAAHAMTPHKGDNAIWKGLRLLSSLNCTLYIVHCTLCNPDAARNLGIYSKDESGEQTVSIGTVESKSGTLIMTLDLRCPVSADTDGIIKAIQGTLDGAGLNTRISKLYRSPPLLADTDGVLVRSLLAAYTAVTGLPPAHIKTGGGTYARALPNSVAFGPAFPHTETNIHNADERISLEQLRQLIDIYGMAIVNLDKNL